MEDRKEYKKKYYAANRDRLRQMQSLYKTENRDKLLSYYHERYLQNSERNKSYAKKYRTENAERLKKNRVANYSKVEVRAKLRSAHTKSRQKSRNMLTDHYIRSLIRRLGIKSPTKQMIDLHRIVLIDFRDKKGKLDPSLKKHYIDKIQNFKQEVLCS
jgi:hypothetical protein